MLIHNIFSERNGSLQNECDQLRDELDQTKKQCRRQEDQVKFKLSRE